MLSKYGSWTRLLSFDIHRHNIQDLICTYSFIDDLKLVILFIVLLGFIDQLDWAIIFFHQAVDISIIVLLKIRYPLNGLRNLVQEVGGLISDVLVILSFQIE